MRLEFLFAGALVFDFEPMGLGLAPLQLVGQRQHSALHVAHVRRRFWNAKPKSKPPKKINKQTNQQPSVTTAVDRNEAKKRRQLEFEQKETNSEEKRSESDTRKDNCSEDSKGLGSLPVLAATKKTVPFFGFFFFLKFLSRAPVTRDGQVEKRQQPIRVSLEKVTELIRVSSF